MAKRLRCEQLGTGFSKLWRGPGCEAASQCIGLDANFSKEFIEGMSEQLADKQCVPCRGGVPPIKGRELQGLMKAVPQWKVVNEHHLSREFKFPDFARALEFVNRVGALAEDQGHHPDILLAWGKAEITLWTHKIDGLTESDFIMAAKIDRLLAGQSKT
jgi:4a-hydroxytetrahydrobiopterin dehydratase